MRHRHGSKAFTGESGYSLVIVLVIVGIVGMIASVNAAKFKNATKVASIGKESQEFRALRRNLLENIDCQRSIGAPTYCENPDMVDIPLRRRSNAELAPGKMLGKWRIHARCHHNTIVVEGHRGTSANVEIISSADQVCSGFFNHVPRGDFGGSFQRYITRQSQIGQCRRKNEFTNACNCPAGYAQRQFNEFAAGGTWIPHEGRCGLFQDDKVGDPYCGYVFYICLRNVL